MLRRFYIIRIRNKQFSKAKCIKAGLLPFREKLKSQGIFDHFSEIFEDFINLLNEHTLGMAKQLKMIRFIVKTLKSFLVALRTNTKKN